MSSESHHHGTNIIPEKKKRGLLLSSRMSWSQLDEDFPVPKAAADNPLSTPQLVDSSEENLCNWMDSGFYLSASKDLQENRDKAAAFSPPSGMVEMTVQNYMRITEWLDFWEKDPVEVLLDLGFGRDEPDICTKIPSRFISCASMAKGINIRVFIEAQRQRMDVENPNLYGRFLQLQVLDHVTSAFSSLLSDVNAMHHKLEEGNREEKIMGETPKGRPMATQAKRRRLSQLLRKASRQTTLHGSQVYQKAGPFKARDDPSETGTDADLRIAARTGLVDNTTLISLKEDLIPSEEVEAMAVSQSPQPRASKMWLLPHLPIKQLHLPSASEMLPKDRSRKESNLRLAHRLRRVPGLSWKPSDSFEMEEIQSFEDESSWGNLLESTSDTIVTRTNSCQSDSSGFLEDPLEPLPLPGLSLPGNMRLGCNPHDCHAFLRYRKDSALTSQDLQPHAEGPAVNTSTAAGRNGVLLASLSREHAFPGEEVFYSINEEDDDLYETFSGQSESAEMDEDEMQGRGAELEKEDSCVQDRMSCCDTDNTNWIDGNPPERNCLSGSSEMHQAVGSAPTKGSCIIFAGLSGGQIFEERKGCEEPATEKEEIRDVCKEHILEGIAMCVEGKLHDMKASGKLDSPIPVADITSDCRDLNLDGTLAPLDITRTSKMEHDIIAEQSETGVISRSSLQDDSLSPYCLKTEEITSLDILATSTELDEDGRVPNFQLHTNPLKSVTVQMPSRLMSSIRSISLGESAVKVQSMDSASKVSQCSKDESLITSAQGASREEDKQMREASIQTDRSRRKKDTLPLFHSLPSFHGHGHLVKSASVDTGLYGKYRSYCHEPFNAWCAQHRGHCCPLSSHHCCLMRPFPSATLCKHPLACCSSHTTTELQLLKMLKLLQDTAMRNISVCTVHEIEVMKNSCQKFRERLDEIEHHLTEQEALFSGAMSNEGREERRQLQDLRQAVRREVAELECQLQDRARQQLDQLLGEQSHLCSELGISGWKEEREAGHVFPDAAAEAFIARNRCSKDIHHRPPSRSATIPSSPSASSLRQTELQASGLATGKTSPASDPEELHTSKKEIKGPPQPKIDFKAFIQNLKKSFRNSFSNNAAEGRD